MNPACFLDRDGVIIEEVEYLSDPDALELIDGAGTAIRRLNESGVPVVVVTNQAGVARGFFDENRVREIHGRLDEVLATFGARIDRYYFCPHHPTAGKGDYLVECECRKPHPGMLLLAANELDLDLRRSFMIGDKPSDLLAGERAGCLSILVRTGYGHAYDRESLEKAGSRAEFLVRDIGEAVDRCLPSLTARPDPSPDTRPN